MTQRDAERHFVQTRPLNLARYTKQLWSGRFSCANFPVLVGPALHDQRDIAEGLDVIDDGGLAEQTGRGRKGRFDARQPRFSSVDFRSAISSPPIYPPAPSRLSISDVNPGLK